MVKGVRPKRVKKGAHYSTGHDVFVGLERRRGDSIFIFILEYGCSIMRIANYFALLVCLTATLASAQSPSSQSYLSPRCASLSDAIRSATARGLRHDTIKQMHNEYYNQCSEEENQANVRLYQERNDKRRQVTIDKANANLDKERAIQHQQQCAESRRILLTKGARTDLNDGEKNELRRFEDNFRNRCN